METVQNIFRYKKADPAKLTAYGFKRTPQGYIYHQTLPQSRLLLTVTVSSAGQTAAVLTDPASGEPYVLHLMEYAAGSFVGTVRQEYEAALQAIADNCFITEIFKSPQTKEIIAYVQQTYQRSLEYLWPDAPQNAIWRRGDNQKWFGVVLSLPKNKLTGTADDIAEIIDLHAAPELVTSYLTREHYYPGWHMNKKHWYTIILDNSLPTEEICRRIDESYQSVANKSKRKTCTKSI